MWKWNRLIYNPMAAILDSWNADCCHGDITFNFPMSFSQGYHHYRSHVSTQKVHVQVLLMFITHFNLFILMAAILDLQNSGCCHGDETCVWYLPRCYSSCLSAQQLPCFYPKVQQIYTVSKVVDLYCRFYSKSEIAPL